MSAAVAYLRRSRVDSRRPGTLSQAEQLAKIRETAARHGDAELTVIEDWGRSGREDRTHLRTGFAELERMVESGAVTAVYAFDLSRLGRSLVTVHRLAKRCAELGIPVRCADGFSPDVSTAQGRMVLNILLAIGQFYAEATQERMRSITMMRRQRGDRIGPAPYGSRIVAGKLQPNPDESIEVLADAYRRAGGVQGACRLLNAEGVRTRGGGPWRPSTLAQVLATSGVRDIRPRRGRPAKHQFLLSGLLRCACGATLTGRTMPRSSTVYECRRARFAPDHGRPASVSERRLMGWIRARAAEYELPPEVEVATGDPEAQRIEIVARRDRAKELYLAGDLDREQYAEEKDRAARALAALEGLENMTTMEVGPIDWDDTPVPALNAVLRAYWFHVQLGPDMGPLAVAWRIRRLAEASA